MDYLLPDIPPTVPFNLYTEVEGKRVLNVRVQWSFNPVQDACPGNDCSTSVHIQITAEFWLPKRYLPVVFILTLKVCHGPLRFLFLASHFFFPLAFLATFLSDDPLPIRCIPFGSKVH